MLSIHRFAAIMLLFFFLLMGTQLAANNARKIEKLEAERKELYSDTEKRRLQIRASRKRILKLKRRIVKLLKQNNMLTLQIEKEIKRYDKQADTPAENE